MSKRKGTSAEREIVHRFWKEGWAAVRAAGSGSMRYPCPDIIAGKEGRSMAIECKATKNTRQYFTKDEIRELKEYSSIMNAEPWVGIRFPKTDWLFLSVDDLEETENHHVITQSKAKHKGFLFSEIL